MTYHDHIVLGLADALLDGAPSVDGFIKRIVSALGQEHDWIKPFAKRVFRKFGENLIPAQRSELIKFIQNDRGYHAALDGLIKPRIRQYFLPTLTMQSRPALLANCAFPDIPTPRDLANWLGISMPELEWYADVNNMIRTTSGPLCHYHYKWIEKRYGYRLIESPKPALCKIQRKILHEILDLVPPHHAAHGFRRGHSCLTYARPHVGKSVIIRLDLRDFFMRIPAPRINALFRTLGYPDGTAMYLTKLCTNSVPGRALLKMPKVNLDSAPLQRERKKLIASHLPQGAPTSPALANLCALHLDYRLSGLAENMNAHYTRYADDIAFSGGENVRRSTERIIKLIAGIAGQESFEINFRKTRIMHKSDRQQLTNIVVNEKININRAEYDRLKAILHNCIRLSPDSQNRNQHQDFHAHLLGRINYMSVLNESRGRKLKALFDQIEWQG